MLKRTILLSIPFVVWPTVNDSSPEEIANQVINFNHLRFFDRSDNLSDAALARLATYSQSPDDENESALYWDPLFGNYVTYTDLLLLMKQKRSTDSEDSMSIASSRSSSPGDMQRSSHMRSVSFEHKPVWKDIMQQRARSEIKPRQSKSPERKSETHLRPYYAYIQRIKQALKMVSESLKASTHLPLNIGEIITEFLCYKIPEEPEVTASETNDVRDIKEAIREGYMCFVTLNKAFRNLVSDHYALNFSQIIFEAQECKARGWIDQEVLNLVQEKMKTLKQHLRHIAY